MNTKLIGGPLDGQERDFGTRFLECACDDLTTLAKYESRRAVDVINGEPVVYYVGEFIGYFVPEWVDGDFKLVPVESDGNARIVLSSGKVVTV